MNRTAVKGMAVILLALLGLGVLPHQAEARSWFGEPRHDYPHYRHYPYGHVENRLPQSYVAVAVGGIRFFYGEGVFYQRHQDNYIVVPPPRGAVVYVLPDNCSRVIVDNMEYYSYNGIYYRRFKDGYHVVEPPTTVIVEPATVSATVVPPSETNEFTVNIPNKQGGFTGVILKKNGNGFTGPQGEFYPEFPKVEQLKLMYVK